MVVFLSKYYFILCRSLCASSNLLFGTPLYILTLLKPLPSLGCRGSHFCHTISTGLPCQISPNDNLTKQNLYTYTMRFLSTLIFILILGSCLGQDTLHYVDMDVIYVNGKIVEKIFYHNGQIDIRVIYIYKEGVLLRREWWQRGKRISYTIDN